MKGTIKEMIYCRARFGAMLRRREVQQSLDAGFGLAFLRPVASKRPEVGRGICVFEVPSKNGGASAKHESELSLCARLARSLTYCYN